MESVHPPSSTPIPERPPWLADLACNPVAVSDAIRWINGASDTATTAFARRFFERDTTLDSDGARLSSLSNQWKQDLVASVCQLVHDEAVQFLDRLSAASTTETGVAASGCNGLVPVRESETFKAPTALPLMPTTTTPATLHVTARSRAEPGTTLAMTSTAVAPSTTGRSRDRRSQAIRITPTIAPTAAPRAPAFVEVSRHVSLFYRSRAW